MEIKDQVCSLELAKKLKEIGMEQESFYSYIFSEFGFVNREKYENRFILAPSMGSDNEKKYSAFTAAELGEMLPNCITVEGSESFDSFTILIRKCLLSEDNFYVPFEKMKIKNRYLINYECDSTECAGENAWLRRYLLTHNIFDENLANAMAKMLIYLIEDGIIKK